MIDIKELIPSLLPKAIEWAKSCEAEICSSGVALNDQEIEIAKRVGVAHAARIRIVFVDGSLPYPKDPELAEVGIATGLFGPDMAGITLGYGIYICRGHASIRLFSHEFRHVHQYEEAGSTEIFLDKYLRDVAQFWYFNSPYEIDARRSEIDSL
jgi:hypothetical protein